MIKTILACEKCKGNCWGCFYADGCNQWNEIAPYNPLEIEVEVDTASMALCEGRHNIPEAENGSIFGNEIDPLAVDELEVEAVRRLSSLDIKNLNLYVTGLTMALVAVLNATRKLGIKVTLYHFNRETGSYYPQEVK